MRYFCLVTLLAGLLVACQSPAGESDSAPAAKKEFPREGTFVGADSLELFFRFAGGGPDTIVVVHGGPGGNMMSLLPDLQPLADKHTLLFYDQRGGGRSALPADSTLVTMSRHVADLEALRKHFGFQRMTLLGHSFGPLLMGYYARQHPERIDRMVLIGPIPPLRGDFFQRYSTNLNEQLTSEQRKQMTQYYQQIINGDAVKEACQNYWAIANIPRFASAEKVDSLEADLCAGTPESITYGMRLTSPITIRSLRNWDIRSSLAKVQAPTLIIHGEEEAIPLDLVREWERSLPQAELMTVPEAAHFPHVERPELVFGALERFLR